jgi:hypothetical protein
MGDDLDRNAQTGRRSIDSGKTVHKFTLYFKDCYGKCLLQRHVSNDLFDLVYSIFINNDISVDRTKIVTTFLRKTIFEPSPQAALSLLLAVPFEVMRGYWSKIVCVKERRMDFTAAVDRFKGELQSMFSSFRYGDTDRLAFFPPELRTPIMQGLS